MTSKRIGSSDKNRQSVFGAVLVATLISVSLPIFSATDDISFSEPKRIFDSSHISTAEPGEEFPCVSNADFEAEFWEIGKINKGPYKGQPLVLGSFAATNCKSVDCNVPSFVRFAKTKDSMVRLNAISNPLDSYVFERFKIDKDLSFKEFGLTQKVDNQFSVPGLVYEQAINGPEALNIVREYVPNGLSTYMSKFGGEEQTIRLEDLVKVFDAKDVGPVYAPRKGLGEKLAKFYGLDFFVIRPDKTVVRYKYANALSWDGSPANGNGQPVYFAHRRANLTEADLKPATTSPEVQGLYEVKDSNNPVLKEIYEEAAPYVGGQDFETFVTQQPVVFRKDPFGSWIAFVKTEVLPIYAVEPLIYLYPNVPTNMQIDVQAKGGVYLSEPLKGAMWKIKALPSGTVINSADERNYRYLFWEGVGDPVSDHSRGFVVSQDEVESFFRSELKKRGLIDNEMEDFLMAWLPHFKYHPYYFVTFLDEDQINKLFPLRASPNPETIIRIYMDFFGLLSPTKVQPLPEPHAKKRKGLTLVEWGGLIRK